MNPNELNPAPASAPLDAARPRSRAASLLKLARPHQWSKSIFVLLGPLYGLQDRELWSAPLWSAFLAATAFATASSACYIVNDLLDVEADRTHPRKRFRPLASGAISPSQAKTFAAALIALTIVLVSLLPGSVALGVGLVLLAYVLNVALYSLRLKHVVIADVVSLALGFDLRMLAGCAAVGIAPSTWLLNATLFLSMFLAFGKRLGERRTMGESASTARIVQARYTDELLRMLVVVTAVATLLTYAGYVQFRAADHSHVIWPFHHEFNVLWLTLLPAVYGLLHAIVLLERGTYDDPTELAVRDRPTQVAGALFALVTIAVLTWDHWAPA